MFDQAIKTSDFNQNNDKPCVYRKTQGSMVVFLVLYINDILLVGNNVGLLSPVKIWLSTQFQMKDLGELQYIIGIKII